LPRGAENNSITESAARFPEKEAVFYPKFLIDFYLIFL
jgi:hypothetical protein